MSSRNTYGSSRIGCCHRAIASSHLLRFFRVCKHRTVPFSVDLSNHFVYHLNWTKDETTIDAKRDDLLQISLLFQPEDNLRHVPSESEFCCFHRVRFDGARDANAARRVKSCHSIASRIDLRQSAIVRQIVPDILPVNIGISIEIDPRGHLIVHLPSSKAING